MLVVQKWCLQYSVQIICITIQDSTYCRCRKENLPAVSLDAAANSMGGTSKHPTNSTGAGGHSRAASSKQQKQQQQRQQTQPSRSTQLFLDLGQVGDLTGVCETLCKDHHLCQIDPSASSGASALRGGRHGSSMGCMVVGVAGAMSWAAALQPGLRRRHGLGCCCARLTSIVNAL